MGENTNSVMIGGELCKKPAAVLADNFDQPATEKRQMKSCLRRKEVGQTL